MKHRFRPSTILMVVAPLFLALAFFSLLAYTKIFPDSQTLEYFSYLPVLQLFLTLLSIGTILFLLGRRRVGIGVALAGLLYASVCGDYSTHWLSLLRHRRPEGTKLTVLAYNVRYFSYGIEEVAATINKIDADVTLLSETTLTPDQVTVFSKLLKGKKLYVTRPDETAIISKYPVLKFQEVLLPSHEASLSEGNDISEVEKRPHRSFSHAVVDVNGTRVNVISIRFIAGRPRDFTFKEKLRWGEYVFNSQKKESHFFISYIKALKGPVIFGGDLNAPPSAAVIQYLNRYATDAWLATNLFGDLTFTTKMPHSRLDYIYSNRYAVPIRTKKYNLIASDHFPIYAEFVLPETRHVAGGS